MADTPRLDIKEKLLNLASYVEQLYSENEALKSLIATARHRSGKLAFPDWQEALQELVESQNIQDAVSARFAPLRQALLGAVDDHDALLALLLLGPTKGKI